MQQSRNVDQSHSLLSTLFSNLAAPEPCVVQSRGQPGLSSSSSGTVPRCGSSQGASQPQQAPRTFKQPLSQGHSGPWLRAETGYLLAGPGRHQPPRSPHWPPTWDRDAPPRAAKNQIRSVENNIAPNNEATSGECRITTCLPLI